MGKVNQKVSLFCATAYRAHEHTEFLDSEVVLMRVTQNIGGSGVAHKDDVESGFILYTGAGIIVTGQRRNRDAACFEGDEIRKAFAGAS
jgi:hypothetical protein